MVETYFNKSLIQVPKIRWKELEKVRFCILVFSKISAVLASLFALDVTLVTAKKQHRCWKGRAYTHRCVHTARVHPHVRRETERLYVCNMKSRYGRMRAFRS